MKQLSLRLLAVSLILSLVLNPATGAAFAPATTSNHVVPAIVFKPIEEQALMDGVELMLRPYQASGTYERRLLSCDSAKWPWMQPFYDWVGHATQLTSEKSRWVIRLFGSQFPSRFGLWSGQSMIPVAVESLITGFVFMRIGIRS
jgi:hypothetical protein